MIPKKHWGQHFLICSRTVQNIVQVAQLPPQSYVYEVGPGQGILTQALLHAGHRIYAREKDPRCVRHLASTVKPLYPQSFLCQEGDALTDSVPEGVTHIVANLPYNIATPLMIDWMQSHRKIPMTVMIQREVAQRFLANPGEKSYGRLAVMTHYWAKGQHHFDVPPGMFSPPPKVMSSVITLNPICPLSGTLPWGQVEKTVKHAFQHQRKMLRNIFPRFSSHNFKDLNLSPTLRPEALSVQDYIRVTEYLTTHE